MSSCLSAELRRALVSQVCCNIPELCDFLECEVDFLWETQDECTERLRYLYTQLGLIEAAQIFSRNKIDTMTRQASSTMNERYSAFSTIRADAERDATGRTCSWAAATSSQFFNRDSEDQAIGWSDYRHKYNSDFYNNGYDKSCRHTTGFGFHNTRVESTHTLRARHIDDKLAENDASSDGGTNGLLPIFGLTWNTSPTLLPIIPPMPDVDDPIPPASDETDLCPIVDNPDFFLECNQGFPSAGYGFHGTFTYAIAIPLVGTLSVSWTQADNRRQYFTCSKSLSEAFSEHIAFSTSETDGATDASEPDNQTYSSEVTNIDHLVRKYGILVRRSTTDNDAQEQAEGFSTGVANSESERNAAGHAYSQSRAEAESTRHAESHFTRTERANNDMISAKYGQISKHLKALWDRVWEHQKLLERQLASRPYGGSMNCKIERKSCLPARRSYHDLKRVIPHV